MHTLIAQEEQQQYGVVIVLPLIVTVVPFCPMSGCTLLTLPGTKYVQSLPVELTRAIVVAVMTTGTDTLEVTSLDCILTLICALVVAVKSISASIPPNVTSEMLSAWPNRLLPEILTVQ